MSTKEELREKARSARRKERGILRWPALTSGAEYFIRMLLGGLLAGAELFDGCAPFALGLVAASGAGMEGLSALAGACAGYLAFRGFVDGLPYLAACILTFSVSVAFYDVRFYRYSWFMPAVATLLCGVTRFVYLSDSLDSPATAAYFATELLLLGAGVCLYRAALSVWEQKTVEQSRTAMQNAGLFALGCTLLVAMAEVRLPGQISLGCTAGAVLTLIAAKKAGAGTGAAAGVCVGLAMGLALGQALAYTTAYAFAGLLAGLFRRQGKLFSTVSYIMGNAVIVLWTWDSGPHLELLYVVFVASVVFMVLPESLLRRAGVLLPREKGEKEGESARTRQGGLVREQLESLSGAFRELYDALRVSFRRVVPNDADCTVVFHRAANRVCAPCALRDHCWQREYASTMNALNDGLPAMLERGRGEAEDFPAHFRSRCLNFPLLLSTANEELTALRCRRQYQSRVRESREAVCRQYAVFARSLDEAAHRLAQEPVREAALEKEVCQRLYVLGLEGRAAFWRDRGGRLILEIMGKDLKELEKEEERERLSKIAGVPLRPAQAIPGGLRWRQAEALMAVAGVAARKKEGQAVSGDAGAWFKTEEGDLFVLLCDGMGSGPEAHRESTLAIGLLEKFLRAGVEPEEALNTLNAALALRWEEEGGFTTIDLFRLDLYTGEAGFYKLGAAPTYIRRRSGVTRVTGASLPAGLSAGDGSGPDVSKLRLEAGDSVLMLSDGVAAPEEDGWVKTALAAYDGANPKALAAALMDHTAHGPTDDRTAVVLTIKNR